MVISFGTDFTDDTKDRPEADRDTLFFPLWKERRGKKYLARPGPGGKGLATLPIPFKLTVLIREHGQRAHSPQLAARVSERTTNNRHLPCMEDSLHLGAGSFKSVPKNIS